MSETRDRVGCSQLIFCLPNWVEHEAYFFVWKRRDRSHFEDGYWRFLRRKVELDQQVLLAKYMKIFF